MTATIIPFNPLEKRNLGASVAEALLAGKVHAMATLEEFKGAGVYAIYYRGDHPAYAEIARRNADGKAVQPIYVGKAVPAGARTGRTAPVARRRARADDTPPEAREERAAPAAHGKWLYKRLSEHADSLRAASNLEIDDFSCRFLVVDDVWIPLGESMLIARYAPVWNSLLDGFGNHNPGGGRYQGLRPRWDVLHPGRAWADRCQARPESAADVQRDVVQYLRTAPFPTSDRFIEPPND